MKKLTIILAILLAACTQQPQKTTWLINKDWGFALEIPADYLVEDNPWAEHFSDHGRRVFSPDSLILISTYAGVQVLPDDEVGEDLANSLAEDGFQISQIETVGRTLIIHARNGDGINYYGHHTLANEDGIEYAVSVQYPDEKADEARTLIKMADRFPAGPTTESERE